MGPLATICALTFLHYVAAQMRGPVLPLYAVAHGVTVTGVGLIAAAHMAVAAAGSIPCGRAADRVGRRVFLLAGIVVTSVTSLLLPIAEGTLALIVVYGVAGLGVAAFTPSAMSLVGEVARPGAAGRAYAWYATAHYGAIGAGPFVGGVVAQWGGYRTAFVAAAGVATLALAMGLRAGVPHPMPAAPTGKAGLGEVAKNPRVWAGWIAAASGLFTQGVVFTFFPLLADQHGRTPAGIGFVFLLLGIANTVARLPAGWLVDRTGRATPYAVGGILVGALTTMLLPQLHAPLPLFVSVLLFGAASGLAGVAIGAALAREAPTARGLVMGGYSTALYAGLALGSFAVGPLIATRGYAAGFVLGGAVGAVGALVAGLLCVVAPARERSQPAG